MLVGFPLSDSAFSFLLTSESLSLKVTYIYANAIIVRFITCENTY